MRTPVFTVMACAVLLTSTLATAQDKDKDKDKKKLKTITLSGCVEQAGAAQDKFMMTDRDGGLKYHLTGKDFKEYLGRPVQVDGGVVVKGLAISGGLRPTANVAAQAGAIDPSRAIVQAATEQSTTGSEVDVQEFRVKTVRSASGACP